MALHATSRHSCGKPLHYVFAQIVGNHTNLALPPFDFRCTVLSNIKYAFCRTVDKKKPCLLNGAVHWTRVLFLQVCGRPSWMSHCAQKLISGNTALKNVPGGGFLIAFYSTGEESRFSWIADGESGEGAGGGTTCDKGLSDNVLRRELASSSVRTGIFAWWFVSCFGNAMGHGCKASFTLDGPRSRLNHRTILERPAFLTDALAAGHTARKDIGKKSNLRNGGRVVENGAPRVCLYPDT